MAAQQENVVDLKDFLTNKLPECLKKCSECSEQLIIDGHKAVTPHILNASDNVSKEQLENVNFILIIIQINKQKIYFKFKGYGNCY